MSSFNDPEMQKEYELEVARVRARLDVEFSDPRVKEKDKRGRHVNFIYTVFLMLLSASIGYWASYINR